MLSNSFTEIIRKADAIDAAKPKSTWWLYRHENTWRTAAEYSRSTETQAFASIYEQVSYYKNTGLKLDG